MRRKTYEEKYAEFINFDYSRYYIPTLDELLKINGGGEASADDSEDSSWGDFDFGECDDSEDSGDEGDDSDSYTVQSGDTLSEITEAYNDEHGTNYTYEEVAEVNGIENPDMIFPDQEIDFSGLSSGGDEETDATGELASTSQAEAEDEADDWYGSDSSDDRWDSFLDNGETQAGESHRVDNTNEAVANARPGDTVQRDDKTIVAITQADIDWAKKRVGEDGDSPATESGKISTGASELAGDGCSSPKNIHTAELTSNSKSGEKTVKEKSISDIHQDLNNINESSPETEIQNLRSQFSTKDSETGLGFFERAKDWFCNLFGLEKEENSKMTNGNLITKIIDVLPPISINFGSKIALVGGFGWSLGGTFDDGKMNLNASFSIGTGIELVTAKKSDSLVDMITSQFSSAPSLSVNTSEMYTNEHMNFSTSQTTDISLGIVCTYDLDNLNPNAMPNSFSGIGLPGGGYWYSWNVESKTIKFW